MKKKLKNLLQNIKERITYLAHVFKYEYRRGSINYKLYTLLSKKGINKLVKNDIKYFPTLMVMYLIDSLNSFENDKEFINAVNAFIEKYYNRKCDYIIGDFKNSFKD